MNDELLKALSIVCNLAAGNCLDQEVEPVDGGDELEQDAFDQRQAIDLVEEWLIAEKLTAQKLFK